MTFSVHSHLIFMCDTADLIYPIKQRYSTCGNNALVKQVHYGCGKILQGSAVMNPGLTQNQVHQEERVFLWPRHG